MGLFDRFKKQEKGEGLKKDVQNPVIAKSEMPSAKPQRGNIPKSASQSEKSGGHGDHWQVVADSGDEIQSIIFGSIEDHSLMEVFTYDGHDVFVSTSNNDLLKACTVAVDGEIYTAYPCAEGIVHEIMLDSVEEWMNGLEAQVKCRLGEAAVSFFDTAYYRNKGKYTKGNTYDFNLSALAYMLKKTEPRTMKDRDGMDISTRGMAAFFPAQQGDIDDFMYHMPVKDVAEVTFSGKSFYRIRAPLFRLSRGDSFEDVDIYLYVPIKATNGYVPKAGDDVTGVLWLQGHMEPKLNTKT